MLTFLLLLIVSSGNSVNALLMRNTTDFKLSEDYIYKVYPNEPERYLNPHSVVIVRNISFLQMESSLQALKHLALKLEEICSEIEMLEAEGAKNYDYEFVEGTFNQSSAKETCANRGTN